MEKINYQNWPNCYRLANEQVELIVTTDVGPRIIRYGFVGDKNEFKEYSEMLGKTGGDEWRIYGGHRFWHAPEVKPRTYFPDNFLVKIESHDNKVRLIQPVETTTGILKEIDIELDADSSHVKVTHRLKNTNLWAVELAPWALSVMAPGGKLIMPLPPRGSHETNLLPSNTLTLWSYTNMADPRWTWGTQYVMLRQDSKLGPQKIGMMNSDGWMAHINAGVMFLKKFTYIPNANYPDWGCSIEAFTDEEMLEVETLAPLCKLEPNRSVEHIEHWFLFKGLPTPNNDQDIDKNILPKVNSAKV